MDESDPSAPLKLDSCFRPHVQSLGKLLPNLSYSFKPLASNSGFWKYVIDQLFFILLMNL